MKISREDLQRAVQQGVLQPGQDAMLWDALQKNARGQPRFDLAHVSYYAGAIIVMGALGWFMTRAWESLPGLVLTAVAVVYATLFTLAGRWVWDRLGLRTAGGLLLTVAVSMTPLALYGILRQFGLWPQGDPGKFRDFHVWIEGSWITLELGTILAGVIMLRFRQFPFLTAPIAVALWYLSMDLAPLLLGVHNHEWQEREWISLWFGLATLVVAYAVDLRGRDEDLSFWIYLFGLLAFWGGLSLMHSERELSKFFYFLINAGLIGMALLLRRSMFAIFGSIGCMGYIGHLAYRIFDDSIMFSLALTVIGGALIVLGIIYQRNTAQIARVLFGKIPAGVQALLPARARNS
jgi:hypothetical protein